MQQVKKKRKDMTMETLLGDPELAIPVANYIDGTGRFKVQPGEHAQTQSSTSTREPRTR